MSKVAEVAARHRDRRRTALLGQKCSMTATERRFLVRLNDRERRGRLTESICEIAGCWHAYPGQ